MGARNGMGSGSGETDADCQQLHFTQHTTLHIYTTALICSTSNPHLELNQHGLWGAWCSLAGFANPSSPVKMVGHDRMN